MKHPCATFSDTRHAVQTTKIGDPTQNTTENWTTKSWHFTGADPGFFLGGGALVSSNKPHSFFLQNTSCIRKPQVISGGVRSPCTLPLDPPLFYIL